MAAKKGSGTVALSIAWSAHKFVDSLLRAVEGEKGIVDTAFVKSSVAETRYFSNPVELGVSSINFNGICIFQIIIIFNETFNV